MSFIRRIYWCALRSSVSHLRRQRCPVQMERASNRRRQSAHCRETKFRSHRLSVALVQQVQAVQAVAPVAVMLLVHPVTPRQPLTRTISCRTASAYSSDATSATNISGVSCTKDFSVKVLIFSHDFCRPNWMNTLTIQRISEPLSTEK